MALQPIPSALFRTADLAADEQFEAWRERIGVIFDVTPLQAPASAGFLAEADAFHLGELVMTRVQFAPQQFLRTERQLRSDMIDHYLVQYYRQGGYVGEVGGRALEIQPGSVSVLDLAQPLRTHATDAETISLVIPRDVMDSLLPDTGNLHGAVLAKDNAALLVDHLSSLERRLPDLDCMQVTHIARATCELIAASILPSNANLERTRQHIQSLRLEQVRRFIDRNLRSAALSPELICGSLGLSRSQLYALFKPSGGVVDFIQQRRLLRIHTALANPDDHRSIATLAAEYGFSSQAQVSRAFRQRFGYPPSDIRRGTMAGVIRKEMLSRAQRTSRDHEPGFDDWIRGLRN